MHAHAVRHASLPLRRLPLPAQTPHTMSMKKVALSSIDVAGKRVLIRVDFNVPQDKKDPSVITNTARCARPDGRTPRLPARAT